ncbi:hypothetical protein BaRGS_00008526, partial [Batillaria attramentaria]
WKRSARHPVQIRTWKVNKASLQPEFLIAACNPVESWEPATMDLEPSSALESDSSESLMSDAMGSVWEPQSLDMDTSDSTHGKDKSLIDSSGSDSDSVVFPMLQACHFKREKRMHAV